MGTSSKLTEKRATGGLFVTEAPTKLIGYFGDSCDDFIASLDWETSEHKLDLDGTIGISGSVRDTK